MIDLSKMSKLMQVGDRLVIEVKGVQKVNSNEDIIEDVMTESQIFIIKIK